MIQGSAGEAAVVAFLAALTRVQDQARERGMPVPRREDMAVLCSDQAHAIVLKACMILGIGKCVQIPAREENNFALDARDLDEAIQREIESGAVPIVAVATTGTTSSCAFDSLVDISAVAKKYNLWVHVDAAYGGAYACLPELSSLFDGLDQVDSFVVNCHKKLLCPFDIAAMYVADRRPILKALSLQPEYLRNAASESGAVVDYEHWQMPLGRRFRSLKLWFVFRRFGQDGLLKHVRQGVRLRAYFELLLNSHPDFEIVVPGSLSLVCFRIKGQSDEFQKRFLDAVKSTGDCFIIHTKLNNRIVLRFACGGIEQTENDVYQAWQVISRVLSEMR